MSRLSTPIRFHLLLTNIGFLAYWLATGLALLPRSWLFTDWGNPRCGPQPAPEACRVSQSMLDLLLTLRWQRACAAALRGTAVACREADGIHDRASSARHWQRLQ